MNILFAFFAIVISIARVFMPEASEIAKLEMTVLFACFFVASILLTMKVSLVQVMLTPEDMINNITKD
jgi:hypothetical protein